jgi:hypothetical protein
MKAAVVIKNKLRLVMSFLDNKNEIKKQSVQ